MDLHKPSNASFPQELRREAVQIAQTYEKANRKVYLKAADRLRMPFWDWTGDDAAQNGVQSLPATSDLPHF